MQAVGQMAAHSEAPSPVACCDRTMPWVQVQQAAHKMLVAAPAVHSSLARVMESRNSAVEVRRMRARRRVLEGAADTAEAEVGSTAAEVAGVGSTAVAAGTEVDRNRR